MRRIHFFKNKILSVLLTFCLLVGLIVVPAKVSDHDHVHAESSSTSTAAKEHNCALASTPLTQEMMDSFVKNGKIDCGNYDFQTNPLFLYATSDISWSGTLTLTEGSFIAICMGGFEYEGGTIEIVASETADATTEEGTTEEGTTEEGTAEEETTEALSGGVYFLDCSVVNTPHADCQAFPDNDVIYMTQGWADLYTDWGEYYLPGTSLVQANTTIALAEDMTVHGNGWAPASPYTLNICLNGHTLTVDQGVDLNAHGGTVNTLDCSTMPKLVHTCTVADDRTTAITNDNVAETITNIAASVNVDKVTFYHLAEDVSFDGTLKAPEGVWIGICLNGFTLTGNIDNSANATGGVYTYTCVERHACGIAEEASLDMTPLTQDIVDLLESYLGAQGGKIEGYFTLEEDITFTSDIWVTESADDELGFCTNGYDITDKAGINLGKGNVIYVDCNVMTVGDVEHKSPLFGDYTYPMAQETLNDFYEALIPYVTSAPINPTPDNYTSSYLYSYVDANGALCYLAYNPYALADGSLPVTNDEYESESIFFSAESDSNGVIGYRLCVFLADTTDTSTRYQNYLDLVKNEDGTVSLAWTTEISSSVEYFNYNSELGVFTAKLATTATDGETETVSYGEEYFLGAKDGRVGVRAIPVTELASSTPLQDNTLNYRYWGEGYMYLFHLTEDISWEGTLTVPEGMAVIIATNGHTATGEYTHGETGGIWIFDDTVHVCASTGESLMPVSNEFIDLMLTMNGGELGMEGEVYVSLSEDITTLDPRFTVPSDATLYICQNGHTLSDEAYASLVAGGGRVILMDCSKTNHDGCAKIGEHSPMIANTNLFKTYYQDSDGVFALGAGTYYLYLNSNVELAKMLTVPAGVDLHICLNGFTIKSPPIIVPNSEAEASENDCSGAITVDAGASLTVYDCSKGQTGLITVNTDVTMTGLGALGAFAVANNGTFVLDSGKLFGMMSLANSGDATVSGGEVIGVIAGVLSGSEAVGDGTTEATLTLSGGSVTALAYGVVGQDGIVTMEEGATVNASMLGIAGTTDLNELDGGADMYLNGGTINVGTVDYTTFQNLGLDLDTDDVSEPETAIGVAASAELVLSEDVSINIDETVAESAETAELLVGENANVTVTPSTSGNSNSFEVIGSNGASTPAISAPEGTIEAGDGYVTETDENGDTVVVPIESTAVVAGSSISTSGLLQVNIYVSLTQSFINNSNARIIITHKEVATEYTVADARVSGSYYIFSVGVNAKDYLESVAVTFTDGSSVWGDFSTSINNYLVSMITDTTGTYDEVKEFCRYIQNYCMAAAMHFGTVTEYAPDADIAAVMDGYTADVFTEYAYTVSGESENVTFAGSSLLLESGTTIRLFFSVADGVDVSMLNVTVDGKSATLTKRGSYYYVDIDNIAAKNLATFYTVDFDGVSVKYCALSYAWYALNSSVEPSADLVDVCEALLGYYITAYAYANR